MSNDFDAWEKEEAERRRKEYEAMKPRTATTTEAPTTTGKIMNNVRRAQVSNLLSSLEGLLADAETIRDEEQQYFDNMPEGFQASERGEAAEAAAAELNDVCDSIQSAIDSIGNISE